MRLIYIIFFFIVSCCIQSYNLVQENVEIEVFDLTDNFKSKILGVVTIRKNETGIQFAYNENPEDSTIDYSIIQKMGNDSIIIYNAGGEICRLTNVKTYCIPDGKITVKKYLYDVPGVFDEEAALFFIDNYGLIAIDVLAGNQLYFEKGTGFSKLIIEQLKNDTQFFRPKLKPPPLPIDYDPREIEIELDTLPK